MRVLHCIASFSGGGAEARLATLCEAAAQRSELAFHVAYLHEGPHLDRARRSGAQLHPLSAWRHFDPRLMPQIATLIRKNHIDIVQTWMPMMDVIGGTAAHVSGRPHLLSECSAGTLYSESLRIRLRRVIGRRAAAIVANSEQGLQYWQGLLAADKLHFIGNPLDRSLLAKAEPVDERRFKDVARGRKLLVYAGRFTEAKNLSRLCEALERLLPMRSDVNVALFGVGEKLEEISARLRSWTPERVRFMGFSSELPSWLKRASAVVLLSAVEGMPNIVLEAAELRVPQVLSDIPQHRAIVGDQGAFFCAPHSTDEVCASLHAALDDVESGARKVAEAHERVAQYDMQSVISAYARLYDKVRGQA